MNKLYNILVILAAFAVVVWCETKPVVQCPDENFDDLVSRITVLPCGTKKCKLTKTTNTTVNFRFKPETTVTFLENNVYATVFGIPLPFIGVTGQNACGNIKYADTNEAAPCPLQPGREYVYENHFPIRELYPETSLTVHWSLDDQNQKKVICFEVPAAIVTPKNLKKQPRT